MINAIRYTEELEKAGFTKEKAQASVKIWMELMNGNFATKYDLQETQHILRAELKSVEGSLRTEIKEAENNLRTEIREVETVLRTEIREVETVLRTEIREVETVLRTEIREVESSLKEVAHQVTQLESKLTIKLGSLMAFGMGLLATLISLKG